MPDTARRSRRWSMPSRLPRRLRADRRWSASARSANSNYDSAEAGD